MEMIQSLTPQFAAALVAGAISLLIAVPAAIMAVVRYRNANYLARNSERAVRLLLRRSKTPFVPFRIIAHHVGGFSGAELRQILVRSGALRFADKNGTEYWALVSSIPRRDRANLTTVRFPVSNDPPQHELFDTQDRSS